MLDFSIRHRDTACIHVSSKDLIQACADLIYIDERHHPSPAACRCGFNHDECRLIAVPQVDVRIAPDIPLKPLQVYIYCNPSIEASNIMAARNEL
jgi:hypothetical protein